MKLKSKQAEAYNKSLENKHKGFIELRDNWNKLYTYMKPFFDGDSDLSASAKVVQHEITMIPLREIVSESLHLTNMMSLEMFSPKLKCPECMKKFMMSDIFEEKLTDNCDFDELGEEILFRLDTKEKRKEALEMIGQI